MDLYGHLKISDNDDGDFELHTEDEIINITKLLDEIHASQTKPQVFVRIMKNGRVLYEEDGLIVKKLDDQRVMSHFICGLNLSKLLWENTGEELEIEIKKVNKKVIEKGNMNINGYYSS